MSIISVQRYEGADCGEVDLSTMNLEVRVRKIYDAGKKVVRINMANQMLEVEKTASSGYSLFDFIESERRRSSALGLNPNEIESKIATVVSNFYLEDKSEDLGKYLAAGCNNYGLNYLYDEVFERRFGVSAHYLRKLMSKAENPTNAERSIPFPRVEKPLEEKIIGAIQEVKELVKIQTGREIVEEMMADFRSNPNFRTDKYAAKFGVANEQLYRHVSQNYRGIEGVREYLMGANYISVGVVESAQVKDSVQIVPIDGWDATAATRRMKKTSWELKRERDNLELLRNQRLVSEEKNIVKKQGWFRKAVSAVKGLKFW